MKKFYYYLLGLFSDTEVIPLFLPLYLGVALLAVRGSFVDLISDTVVRKYFSFGTSEIMWTLFGIQGLIYSRKKMIPHIFPITGKWAIAIGLFLSAASFLAVFLGIKAILLK